MSKTQITLVCFAVKEEASGFKGLAGTQPGIEVLLTGMGRRNAERTIRASLARARPQLVVSAGFAGGLTPDLSAGTIVFTAEGAPGLEAGLLAVGARPARFYCSEQVASTAAEKRALRERTRADAVEMESETIRAVCRENNVPCVTVRVILDSASEDLPLDFNELMTGEQKLSGRKLALALFKSPLKIPALLRLQKQSAAAAKRLGEVLTQILKE